jgi:long-chain acyl-CoA synthetase
VAKGAILTHGNLVANVEQMHRWVGHDLQEGTEAVVLPLPLYHVYALTANLVFVKIGAHINLITNPRDIPAFIAELRKNRFSAIVGINTLYNALLNDPGFARVPTAGLKVASAGGMAVQRAVAEKWKRMTGVPIIEGYGLTETSPFAICNATNIDEWTGSIGLPMPSTEAAVVDEQGSEMPIGEVGEICVRGPQVMKGYWNRPDETAKVFTGDGWLRTGDMGYVDALGYFRITDRKKDLIIVSGFKVFPAEIEDVVMMHPGVLEAAAVGAPDPKSGEVVKIVVVKRDPALSEEALLDHCKKLLTGYKIPKIVEFRSQPLPKSNIGKILRRTLRSTVPA